MTSTKELQLHTLVVRWLFPVLYVKRRMLRSSEVAIDLTRFSGVTVEVEHTFLNSLYICKSCMSRVERAGREPFDTVKVFVNGIEELFNRSYSRRKDCGN